MTDEVKKLVQSQSLSETEVLSIHIFRSGMLGLATKGSVSRLKKNLFHYYQPQAGDFTLGHKRFIH